ncbi:MAG: hypothetical protein WCC53_07905 [Thermoanaerobaculia bacterium]|jgi:hypothetical protein
MRDTRHLLKFQATFAARLLVAAGAASAFSAASAQTQAKAPAIHVATPTPAPASRAMVQPAVQAPTVGLPAPGALHYTTDIGACKRAGGNDGTCGALLNQNAVAFYFNWNCSPNCAITGFKLKDANRPAPAGPGGVARILGTDPTADAIDTSKTMLFIERPPQGGWANRCYVVTAYRVPVPKLVPDGQGGFKPSGPATGSFEESPASPKACVGALTREVSVAAFKARSFARSYFFTEYTPHQTKDDPPSEDSSIRVGKTAMGQSGFSVLNKFFRAGASFDAAPLGDVTVYGGRFAYDTAKDCRPRFYAPAPSNWESSAWPKASGAPLPGSWGGSGNTHTWDVASLVRGWRAPRRLSFFLMESLTEGLDAEGFNYSVGMMDRCDTAGQNVRLVLDVGLTK